MDLGRFDPAHGNRLLERPRAVERDHNRFGTDQPKGLAAERSMWISGSATANSSVLPPPATWVMSRQGASTWATGPTSAIAPAAWQA